MLPTSFLILLSILTNALNLLTEAIVRSLFHSQVLGFWSFFPGLSLTKTTTFSLLASLNGREANNLQLDAWHSSATLTGHKASIALKPKVRGDMSLNNIEVHVHESVHVSEDGTSREWGSGRRVNVHLSPSHFSICFGNILVRPLDRVFGDFWRVY